MPEGANKTKGADALADALAKAAENSINTPQSEMEKVIVATPFEEQTLAEVLSSDPPEIIEEKPHVPVLVKLYDIMVDSITGASIRPEEQNITVLKGRVTSADLDAAGVDKAWLIKSGAIVDAGFDYV